MSTCTLNDMIHSMCCGAPQQRLFLQCLVGFVHAIMTCPVYAEMHGYVPVNTGTRFSAKARRPSSRSSVGSTWTMAKRF